jgi:hypothetical protein
MSESGDNPAAGAEPNGTHTPGKPAEQAAPRPLTGSDVIPPSRNPLLDVLVPIFLVVFCALMVGAIARWNLFNCNDYVMLILAYSLLFGAGGMVLGGALRVQGQFKPFGIPWTVDAAGGIAAAVIAGFVAYSMKPACSFDSKIQITDIPLREPDQNGPVKTFVTVEVDSNVEIQRGSNQGTLNFNFGDGNNFGIIIRAYRQEGEHYKFLAACEVKFAHARDTDINETKDEVVYWLRANAPLSFSFNASYFKLLADADRNSTVDRDRNTCLQGSFAAGDSKFETTTAITPLQIMREKIAQIGPRRGRLGIFFTQKRPTVPTDNKEAVKEVAQTEVSPSNEVLTSPGTGGQIRPPVSTSVKENSSPAQPVPATPPAGCLSDLSIRMQVDAFLNGDDLDKKIRQGQIYQNWADINCYVLPIAVGSNPGVSPLQQSRALKLLINAIINNSNVPADPYYWQSDGANRRDFKKQLPYIQDANLQRIFELIPSDDVLIRAEALRLVKLLPVNGLERLFKQKLQHLKTTPNDKREPIVKTERFAVAGISLYYNRTVEWLKENADATTRGSIDTDFAAGMEWASDNYFNARSAKPYEATLLYAKGIVEREQKLTDDAGASLYRATFTKMITRLKQTEDSYPLRPLHIAQALAFISNLQDAALTDILKQIRQADQLTPTMALDDSSPFAGKTWAMYAGPKKDLPIAPTTSASTKDAASVLLRFGDWYFVRGNGKIGWIIRQ